jgi:ornithine carbamoyltransferase
LHLTYFGDGDNNMSHSLLLGCGLAGMNISIVAPKSFWPHESFVKRAQQFGVDVSVDTIGADVAKDADVVVTDTWISMGDEQQKKQRQQIFSEYTVTTTIMNRAKKDAIFLHCLPAYYGNEVTKEVAHGSQSVIFEEAENRLWAQMAVIKWLME